MYFWGNWYLSTFAYITSFEYTSCFFYFIGLLINISVSFCYNAQASCCHQWLFCIWLNDCRVADLCNCSSRWSIFGYVSSPSEDAFATTVRSRSVGTRRARQTPVTTRTSPAPKLRHNTQRCLHKRPVPESQQPTCGRDKPHTRDRKLVNSLLIGSSCLMGWLFVLVQIDRR